VWLDQAINAVDSNKKNVTPKLKQLVYMTQVYNQLCRTVLYGLKDKEFHVKVAQSLDEACKLLEVGFEYVTDIDGTKLFKKRK